MIYNWTRFYFFDFVYRFFYSRIVSLSEPVPKVKVIKSEIRNNNRKSKIWLNCRSFSAIL